MMKTSKVAAVSALALFIACDLGAGENNPGPVFAAGGPDAAAYGQAEGYPVGTHDSKDEQKYMVGLYSHWDQLFPTHMVKHPSKPWQFRRAAEPEIRYDFGGHSYAIADYLAHVPVTGLLIVRGDTILAEHYQYARTDQERFASNSMSKTLISILMGVAIAEKKLRSIDDLPAAYLPSMRGSLYGETPLRVLLEMSSGVAFEGGDAEGQFYKDLYTPDIDVATALAKFQQRAAPQGTHFHYSCGDTETLTTVLRKVVGMPLSQYLSEKIWKPIGAEGDGAWVVSASDQEVACWGFNATLRDYGRLGRLLANDGAWNGRQLIPRQWVIDATTHRASDAQVAPGVAAHYYGYGYQLWILPGSRRMFALIGANGQFVFVDPKSGLVLVQTAVRIDSEHLTSPKSETLALWLAVVQQFGGE